MKKIHALLPLLFSHLLAQSQCSSMGLSVSTSDTTSVQLYQAGFFLLPSGFANVCAWEVTTFSGDIVQQATTSGDFPGQAFMAFDHTVPITDSMQVTLVITNDSSGITCTVIDTLYWQETEVIPGVFIGNWALLGNSGGLQTGLADPGSTDRANITVFPSPAVDHVQIRGVGSSYAVSIMNVSGALVATHANMQAGDRVDVAPLPAGVYLMHLSDDRSMPLGILKFVKL